MDDYRIIKRCIAGDKEQFTKLVNRYRNLVYAVIIRMINDPEETNDLTQEVFIKIYSNLDKYKPTYKFSTWLIRITTNMVIDYQRKKRIQTVSIEEVTYVVETTDSPEVDVIENERKKVIINMVEGLPDIYKIPIVLYHQQGLSYQEISQVINEPLSKVKNRIFRGRKMLKQKVSQMEEVREYFVFALD